MYDPFIRKNTNKIQRHFFSAENTLEFSRTFLEFTLYLTLNRRYLICLNLFPMPKQSANSAIHRSFCLLAVLHFAFLVLPAAPGRCAP